MYKSKMDKTLRNQYFLNLAIGKMNIIPRQYTAACAALWPHIYNCVPPSLRDIRAY